MGRFNTNDHYDGQADSGLICRHLRDNPKLAAEWRARNARQDHGDDVLREMARRRMMPWFQRLKERITGWLKSH